MTHLTARAGRQVHTRQGFAVRDPRTYAPTYASIMTNKPSREVGGSGLK
jgi:hypothetical protein